MSNSDNKKNINIKCKTKKSWLKICLFIFLAILIVIVTYSIYFFSSYSKNTDIYATTNTTLSNVYNNQEYIFIDGPGLESALIYYPGANIESEAYCNLLKPVADAGIDVFIAKPFLHFQLFQINQAQGFINQYNYTQWYIAGHSLGGVVASMFCKSHPYQIKSIIHNASYSNKNIKNCVESCLSINGSNDKIASYEEVSNHAENLPENSVEFMIDGGNHAQFGNYGEQSGDGEAEITADDQQQQAAKYIINFIHDQ